jgi:hypothetical protein
MLTSEIFEMQEAYGEKGYFDGLLEEFINDVVPQLDLDQWNRLRVATWDHYRTLIKNDNDDQKDLPF